MKPIRVLIADDDQTLARTTKAFLEHLDEFVVCGVAHDGHQALAMIESTQPDVVLLDITMPMLDGMGVLENLNTPKRPRFIVITALEIDSVLSRMVNLGAEYVMVKPCDLNILAQRILQFSGERPRDQITEAVAGLLTTLGVPKHLKGFAYLVDAITQVAREPELLGSLKNDLYPDLANKHQTTPEAFQAALRTAIQSGWDHGSQELKNLFIPFMEGSEGHVPGNAAFIARLADQVAMNLRVPSA